MNLNEPVRTRFWAGEWFWCVYGGVKVQRVAAQKCGTC